MVVSSFKLLVLLFLLGAQEGTVKRIRFEGNRHFSDSRLAKVIYMDRKASFTLDAVSKDSIEILRFYHNQGFPLTEVRWAYLENRRALTYYIEEGMRLRISGIEVIGALSSDLAGLRSVITIRKNTPPVQFWINDTEAKIKRYYQNRGYYNAVVQTDTSIQDENIQITYTVAPGNKVWISGISFKGAEGFVDTNFLARASRLSKGELYSASRVDRASRLLYSTYLFTRVELGRYPPLSGSDDSLGLLFTLTPDKTRSILLGGGIQTAENGYIPDRLLLSAGWENLNLFKKGITLSTNLTFNPIFVFDFKSKEFDWNYEFKAEIRNRYPYFLPWGINFGIYPYFEHSRLKDSVGIIYNYFTLGGELGVDKDISDRLRVALSMQGTQTWVPRRDTANVTNFLRTSLIYDTRNDFFNPSAGVFFYPYLDWAGRPFGGDNHFARLAADFRNYLALPFKSVLAWRLRVGWIIPHSGMNPAEISKLDKFYLGGSGSVRALYLRSVGPDSTVTGSRKIVDSITGDTAAIPIFEHYGTFLFLHNLELRTPYFFNLVSVAVFLDAGACSRDLNDTGAYWGWGPGIGVRVQTPIGPVRLDYAKDARKPFSENWGRIEIGFLQAF